MLFHGVYADTIVKESPVESFKNYICGSCKVNGCAGLHNTMEIIQSGSTTTYRCIVVNNKYQAEKAAREAAAAEEAEKWLNLLVTIK